MLSFLRVSTHRRNWRSKQSISRILFSARGCPPQSNDHSSEDAGCPASLATYPGARAGQPSNAPLFGLAPGGVYRASPVTRGTGALLPHRFTLTPQKMRGGLLSVALSFASPRLHVMEHPALRCSDFPPGHEFGPAIVWTASTAHVVVMPCYGGCQNQRFFFRMFFLQPLIPLFGIGIYFLEWYKFNIIKLLPKIKVSACNIVMRGRLRSFFL